MNLVYINGEYCCRCWDGEKWGNWVYDTELRVAVALAIGIAFR